MAKISSSEKRETEAGTSAIILNKRSLQQKHCGQRENVDSPYNDRRERSEKKKPD